MPKHTVSVALENHEYDLVKDISEKHEWSMSKVCSKLIMLAIEKKLLK